MWYKKKTDAIAKLVAEKCGITESLLIVGDILHEDDLEALRTQLFNIEKHTMFQLFEETTLQNS